MSTRRFRSTKYLAGGAILGLVLAGGAGAGVTVLALAPGAGANTAVAGCSGGPTVAATGSGMADGTPDLLTIQIGVQTSASNAAAALSANNAKAQSLIATLERGGVKTADIQTSNLSINPNYSNGPNPKITGYQVNDDLTVLVRQLSSAGSLIDAAAAKLGNNVTFNGLAFSVSNPSGPSAAARANAVQVAEADARSMAGAAGSTLGPLCSIDDNGSSVPPPILSQSLPFASGTPARASVPVQPGSQQFTAQVTVKYRLG